MKRALGGLPGALAVGLAGCSGGVLDPVGPVGRDTSKILIDALPDVLVIP